MTFLPIVERELRIGARRAAPRYVRLVVAAVALLIGLFQVGLAPLFSRSGSAAFGIMTGYAFFLCVAAGVFVTADCLSEEKRGGTLGLLFLTDLRGYDVVLGKLASQLVHLGYALFAIIPGAALPLLLGGVTGGELLRISLALMNLLFFSLAAGVFASSVCREAGRAMMLTAVLLTVFCLGLPLLQETLVPSGSAPAGLWAGWASPAVAYVKAMESAYLRASNQYWISLAGSHGMAWLLIAGASAILPHSWHDRTTRSAGTNRGNSRETGVLWAGSSRNRAILDEDPLLWLIGERKGAKAVIWGISTLWAGTTLFSGVAGAFDATGIIFVAGYIGLFLTKVLFTAEACRFFTETRRAGAFELLLATPVSASRFVSAQWTALRKLFIPPLLVAAGGTALGIGASIFIHGSDFSDMSILALAGGIGSAIVLLVETLDFFALGWLGMWLALTMRKPQLAVGATLLYVVVLPWATCHASIFIGFLLDIILIAVFASKLHTDFRQVIMNRPLLASAAPGLQG